MVWVDGWLSARWEGVPGSGEETEDSLRVVKAVSVRLLPRTTTATAAAVQRDELVERSFRGGQLRRR
jgi:hypothetical protein